MRKVLKWVGIIISVLLLVVIIAGVVLYLIGRGKLNKTYEVAAESITIPSDEAALARGEHIAFAISLCAECHGDDLGGKNVIDSAVMAKLDAPNLTSGAGGVAANYTSTEDWVRAIRHGVKPNGEAIQVMPSDKYFHLSDADLGAVIAYVQSVPPVDSDELQRSFGPMGMILLATMMGVPVEKIDDHAARPPAPDPGVSAEYGEYLVTVAGCQDCHGEDLDGKVPPGAPSGPDLTQSGEGGDWTEADFVNTIRTGVTSDGDTLDPDEMPWDYYTRMTDKELSAIWAYLQTLE